ncbi:helix-turn-helix transcriptional regulator [Bradyrhizobium sp. 191]|uniref:helix-turn-helix domain-containing protein n=1 Tax=Bradyrhizobium sp. 191 TaxID=2782659 RepID=UPI00200025F3|nr:helix-turn-helix transcriptional regulator [Bradyrhizobium sp. 191]UPJ68536.1 helix-turn-helix transcriptional regulator [Bradyrhizobium sp. 191]
MPQGQVDHPAVARLRELADERPWSRRELARRLGLNHSLVTRALAGHPVTQTNASLIEQRLDRLRNEERPPIDVSFATELLLLLQRALRAYGSSQDTKKRSHKS